MKNKIGIILMIIGAGLLLCALGFLIYNNYDEKRAAEQSALVLSALTEALPNERRAADSELEEILEGSEMASIEIDGEEYIGVLDIPSQGLSLPVMKDWSYPKLRSAPCRYKGSIFDDSLILVAHNYRQHFGKINNLRLDDIISFTDVDANVYSYRVSHLETISGTAVEDMEAGDWDMTLFTCNYSGQSRVTVRCVRVPSIV